MPVAVDQGLGILVWSPIAGGLLSGKYRRGVEAPAGSRHLTEWSEPPVYDEDKLYDTIEELVAIGADHGVSAAQVALAYTIGKPAVTSVIVGARTEEQLADNLASAELTLVGGRGGASGQGQRSAAALSVLAPGQHLERSPEPGRSHAAGPPHQGLSHCSCIVLFLASGLIAGVIAWNSGDVLVGPTLVVNHLRDRDLWSNAQMTRVDQRAEHEHDQAERGRKVRRAYSVPSSAC